MEKRQINYKKLIVPLILILAGILFSIIIFNLKFKVDSNEEINNNNISTNTNPEPNDDLIDSLDSNPNSITKDSYIIDDNYGSELNTNGIKCGVKKWYGKEYRYKKNKNFQVRFRWSADGSGDYIRVGPALSDETEDSKPWFLANLTLKYSKEKSLVVKEKVWYYTRIIIEEGSFVSITSTHKFDDEEGTIIQKLEGKIPEIKGYNNIIFAIWECKHGQKASAYVNKPKLSNIKIEKIKIFEENFDFDLTVNNPRKWIIRLDKGCAENYGEIKITNGELNIARYNSKGCENISFLEKLFSIDVNDSTRISFDVKPVYLLKNKKNENNPAFVSIYMVNRYKDTLHLKLCYNYKEDFYSRKYNKLQIIFPKCQQNVWSRQESFRLREYFPDATKIIKIALGGQGLDYESYFDNIIIYEIRKYYY